MPTIFDLIEGISYFRFTPTSVSSCIEWKTNENLVSNDDLCIIFSFVFIILQIPDVTSRSYDKLVNFVI